MIANTGQEVEKGKVFLCHKCDGLLFPQVDDKLVPYPDTDVSGLKRCKCISGYVREWYVATPISKA